MFNTFENILVATDFSPNSEAVLRQAILLANLSQGKVTLIHVLPNLAKLVPSGSSSSEFEMFLGEGERFQEELCVESDARMRLLIANVQTEDQGIHCRTLLGDAATAIIEAVQHGKHDLVLVGTRGHTAWEKVFVGSTTKRLMQKCPVPVWSVKGSPCNSPVTILQQPISRLAVLRPCSWGEDLQNKRMPSFTWYTSLIRKTYQEAYLSDSHPMAFCGTKSVSWPGIA